MKTKTIVAVLLIIIFAALLRDAATLEAQNMVGETVPQSQQVLDSYFTSNAIPNQLQYWELIDSLFYYYQSAYTNAMAAQQAAATVSNAEFCVTAIFQMNNTNGGTGSFSMLRANGIATNYWSYGGSGGCVFFVTNYFTQPMPDMLWTKGINIVWSNGPAYNSPTFTYESQTDFVFTVQGDCPNQFAGGFYLQIYK